MFTDCKEVVFVKCGIMHKVIDNHCSFMKIVRRKYPDRLADSCKRLSANRMAAGSRLPRSSHGFFSSFSYFSNILSAVNINILGLYKAYRLCLYQVL